MTRDELRVLLVRYLALSMGVAISEVNEQLSLIGRGDLLSGGISAKNLTSAVEHVEAELDITVKISGFMFGVTTINLVLQVLEGVYIEKYGKTRDAKKPEEKGGSMVAAVGGGLMADQLAGPFVA